MAYLFCKVYLFLFSFCNNWIFSQGIIFFFTIVGRYYFFSLFIILVLGLKSWHNFQKIINLWLCSTNCFPEDYFLWVAICENFLQLNKRKILFHILFSPKIDLINKNNFFCYFTTYKTSDKFFFSYECFSCLKTKLLLLLLYKILTWPPWTL